MTQADLTEQARAFFTWEYMTTTPIERRIQDVAAALQSASEAAAAKARRAACKAICHGCKKDQELVEDRGTLMHRHPDTGKLYLHCNAEDIHRLASPAPQEETR